MRRDSTSLRGTPLGAPPDGQPSGVLIKGIRLGAVFVPTEVLISADTLGDEDAIRAWLAEHDIHVVPACATAMIRSSEPAATQPDHG
jgi:hypothetical protein